MNKRFPALVAAALSAALLSPSALSAALEDQLMEAAYNYDSEPSSANLAKVSALLKKGAKAHPANEAMTTFSYALDRKNKALVELFLKQQKIALNAPLNADSSETPLTMAVRHGGDKPKATAELVQVLLAAGAKPDYRPDPEQATALGMAAGEVSAEAVQYDVLAALLNAGADPKLTYGNGFTVLTGAAAGDLKALELLLAKGADPYAVTNVGSTPLHFVCSLGGIEARKTDPTAAKRIALLLKPGAAIDAHYPQKQLHPIATPLGEALSSHNPDCVRALLAAGAKPDALMYPESIAKLDPSVKGETVRKAAKKGLKEYPNLYSKAVVDLFK